MYKNDTFNLQNKRNLIKESGFPLQRLAKPPVRHSFTFSAALDTEWPALFCTHVSVYVVSLRQIWRQRCCPLKLSFSICMSGGGERALAMEERSVMAGSLVLSELSISDRWVWETTQSHTQVYREMSRGAFNTDMIECTRGPIYIILFCLGGWPTFLPIISF